MALSEVHAMLLSRQSELRALEGMLLVATEAVEKNQARALSAQALHASLAADAERYQDAICGAKCAPLEQ